MEDPEAYLRAMAARLAWAQEGSPLPVTRFSVEAVANAFVMLGLLPAARAEEILAAQRPVLEAAGFRVGLEIGELSVTSDARAFQEARATGANSPRWTPLAVAAGPVRCRLPGHDLTITSATLTPEGIWLRYHGDAQEGDRRRGRRYRPGGCRRDYGAVNHRRHRRNVPGASGPGERSRVRAGRTALGVRQAAVDPRRRLPRRARPGEAASGGGRPAVRWLEFSAGPGQGTPPVRLEIRSPAAVPTGTTEPAWPTPAEAYLAELAPVYDWSIGSFETGSVELDAPEIVAAVASALLAVGALPPGSALLTAAQYRERRPARADWQRAVTHMWADDARERVRRAGRANGAGLAVPVPLEQAAAVIENITAHEDLVSVRLYGYPWVPEGSFPMIAPCFRVTAIDDTGVKHDGVPDSSSYSPAHDGTGSFWFWPPVPTQAKQLRVIVSTLWEAAWALIDIPGR